MRVRTRPEVLKFPGGLPLTMSSGRDSLVLAEP